MPLDTSIYSLIKPVEAPDMLGTVGKVMALKNAQQTGDLQAQAAAREAEAHKIATHQKRASIFGSALEPLDKMTEAEKAVAYPKVIADLSKSGVITPEQGIPSEYDPTFFSASIRAYQQTPDYLERTKTRAEINHLGAQTAKSYAEAKAAGVKAGGAKATYEALPPENQKQIEKLAGASADKKSIKNQIDSALTILDSTEVDETQKVVIGQQLLKTLNSTEGKDAVGSEEAKRLGSLLEKKVFNFLQPGSMFGRDLPEFVNQVKLTSGAIGQAVDRNSAEVDKLYGRPVTTPVSAIPVPATAQKSGAALIPEAQASDKNPHVKELGGRTYVKVKGGWQVLK